MAANHLVEKPKPLSLQGNLAENFKSFKQMFEFYLTATERNEKASSVQFGILMSCIGEHCLPIYNSFQFDSDEDKQDYAKVLKKFEQYCEPRKNLTMLRHKLLTRKQRDGEKVDTFITELKIKAKDCALGELRDSLVKDMIICGVSNPKLQLRLLEKSQQVDDLKLDDCVKLCQAFEYSEMNRKDLDSTASAAVDSVKAKWQPHKSNYSQPWQGQGQGPQRNRQVTPDGSAQSFSRQCDNCGRYHQPDRSKCPASGQECRHCHKIGHFKLQCKKRLQRVHSVQQEDKVPDNETTLEGEVDRFFINTVSHCTPKSKGIYVSSVLCEKEVKFKLDTGAHVSTLPLSTYNALTKAPKLQPSSATLISYSNHTIPVAGEISLPIKIRDAVHSVRLVVVNQACEPILSLQDCLSLELISPMFDVRDCSPEAIINQNSDVFTGLGCIGSCHITLDKSVSPAIHPPRHFPYAQLPRIKETLQDLEKANIITKVDRPTDWVSSMIVVEKADRLQIVLDPRDLNKAIKRQHFPSRTAEEISARVAGSTVFTTLDANVAFNQFILDEESSYLCTMNTPCGRYRWLRMPYGLSCCPEVLQAKMEEIFSDLQGVEVLMDDLLIHGQTLEKHNEVLTAVLQRAKAAGLTLNRRKITLAQQSVKFVGHVFSAEGLHPDPDKVRAIREMPAPSDKAGVRRFLGCLTYVAKFIPNLSTVNEPLRQLLREDTPWCWESNEERCFERLKELLTDDSVLAYYDVNKELTITCDASSQGLGATLWQDDDQGRSRPVHYASRGLTDAERNYAQIEKECLAIQFACTRFHQYIYGKLVTLKSDHKPLESIFKKPLATAPARIQRMLLHLQKYDLHVVHISGTQIPVSDMLS